MEAKRQRSGRGKNHDLRLLEEVSANPAATRDFDMVRPTCVMIMGCPTVANLNQLSSILPELSPVIEPCLLDYIIYPLSHHLKRVRMYSDEVQKALYNCMKICLGRWEMVTFPCFAELYQFCMMSLCTDDDPGNYDKDLSEEMTEHIITTLKVLIEKSVVRHRKRLYSDRYIAAVGHGICILLQIVNQDTAKSLRITSIKTVVILIQACVGEAMACHRIFKFLPGLATTFVRCCIIRGGRYQIEVIKESLDALKYALWICTSYETAEDVKVVDNNILLGLVEISDNSLFHFEVSLRKSLADFSVTLLRETEKKLPGCAEVFWNNVLILCSDDDEEVSSHCAKYLKTPESRLQLALRCNFTTTQYDLRKSVVQRRVGEDQKCIQTAKKAAASFLVTKFKIGELRDILPRLIDLMSTCIRLDIEIRKETADDVLLLRTCKHMCHWVAESQTLAEVLNVFIELLDSCNTVEEISSIRSAGLVKCMNEVLSHLASTVEGQKKVKRSVMRITSRYIGLLNVLPKTVETAIMEHACGKPPSPPVKLIENPKYIQANAVHNSCLLEGLGTLAKLDPDYVTPEALSRILEYAGIKDIEYSNVARTALKTLDTMTADAGQTLEEYMHENLDLIMSDIAFRATNLCEFPHTADALVFLADYFDFSQSNFVTFVEQIFQQCNQSISFKKAPEEMFCRIFYAFILSLWKYYYEIRRPTQKPVTQTVNPDTLNHARPRKYLLDRMCEYQSTLGVELPSGAPKEVQNVFSNASEEVIIGKLSDLQLSDSKSNSKEGRKKGEPVNPQFADAEEDEFDSDDEPVTSEKSLPPKPEVALTLRISNTVVNNLPDPDRAIKLISMDILIKAVQILQDHEDSLLPLTHQIWQNLVARFAETDYVVVRKAFELLLTMCTSSGTFLKRRAVEEVFPMLANYLKSLGEQSRHIDSKSRVYYTYTQAYKLQMTMLKGMAQLCKAMEIQERDLDRVTNGCLTYLPPDQHKNLRDAAKDLLLELGKCPLGSSVRMKILANEIEEFPPQPSNPWFKMIPPDLTLHSYAKVSATNIAIKKKKRVNN